MIYCRTAPSPTDEELITRYISLISVTEKMYDNSIAMVILDVFEEQRQLLMLVRKSSKGFKIDAL